MSSEVDNYIASFPEDVQEILNRIRNLIKEIIPDGEEVIRYGIPTVRMNRNLVHYAAFKKHIGFYPTPSAIERFKEELRDYECSIGTVKMPLDKPIPYQLIEKIVRFRISENLKLL